MGNVLKDLRGTKFYHCHLLAVLPQACHLGSCPISDKII